MAFAGNDPTGGAGLQADIEAITSQGCHPAPVITAVTVQDTRDVMGFQAVDGELVMEQARAVLEDMPVAAIKIGMVGNATVAESIHALLVDYPHIPVVLDPVLASGRGTRLADDELLAALNTLLVPRTTVLTPNGPEARALAPEADSLEACAMSLLERGCEYVLVTGGHEKTPGIVNTLYGNHRLLERFTRERLPGAYHGSGCTLSSTIAGLLAQGLEVLTAVYEAQEYTWETLRHAYRIGMGQALPNRLFWAQFGNSGSGKGEAG